MKKVFISILLVFISFTITNAQIFEIPFELKMETSDLIIEGEIVEQEFFYDADGYISTRNKILPTKLFKGKFSSNSPIYVITKGGAISGIVETWTHLLNLKIGDYGVFFLQSAENLTKNTYYCYSSRQGFYSIREDYHGSKFFSPFDTSRAIDDDLYLKIYDYTGKAVQIIENNEAKNMNDNCMDIEIKPENNSYRGSNFNLGLYASMTISPMYFQQSQINITYDVSQFGDSIVSNGKVSIFPSVDAPVTRYSFTLSDVSRGIFRIEINSLNNNFTLLDLFKKKLYNISFNVDGIFDFPLISIDENQIISNTLLVDSEGNSQNPMCLNFGFTFQNQRNCPIITSISPVKVAAGVNDTSYSHVPGIVTITGMNFGDHFPNSPKPFESDILFWDVDQDAYFPSPELNYISWTDTQIVVRVPTMTKQGGPYNTMGAATKEIIIQGLDDLCLPCSDTSNVLYIKFGAYNDYWSENVYDWRKCDNNNIPQTSIFGGKRRNLVNQNGSGGYNLIIDDLYPNDSIKNQKAYNRIVDALDTWRCPNKNNSNNPIGINVSVVPNTPPYSSDTTTCRVKRSNLPTGLSSTQYLKTINTPSSLSNCDTLSNIDSKILKFEILVNMSVLDTFRPFNTPDTWRTFYLEHAPPGTETISQYKKLYDLQKIATHEFGHAFQLRHTANASDLMVSGSLTNFANTFDRNLRANDLAGAFHIRGLSQEGACGTDAMSLYVCSTPTKGVEAKSNISISPNPFDDYISIYSKYKSNLILYDLLGKKIFQQKIIDGKTMINVSMVPRGVYLATLTNKKGIIFASEKIIKLR